MEPTETADGLARSVIGAAIEVHRHLGPGLLEGTYQRALGVEMEVRNIPFEREVPVALTYKHRDVATFRIDLLVDGALIVEVKAVEGIAPIHVAQVLTYLKVSSRQLGLLLNFNVPTMREGIRRVIWTSR